jgi:hypothetical protein
VTWVPAVVAGVYQINEVEVASIADDAFPTWLLKMSTKRTSGDADFTVPLSNLNY